jgi:[glutamine synthetase] adenylyltransferase / [glutamine synthetase]-adenylyl-L-tyrosine phosphorylase
MLDQHRILREQLIDGHSDILEIAQSYAHFAEETLVTLTNTTVTEFERTHGKIVGCELVIVALGSLGGGQMTPASDLDIILLFTGNPTAQSDGPNKLDATQYYNQLAKQVIIALNKVYETGAGFQPWYTEDTFCTSVKSFEQYHRENAWPHEHIALARARVVFGSSGARTEVDTIIRDILLAQRNAKKLRHRIAVRREDVAVQHHPAEGALDVKWMSGGLMDMIFITHTLQLETQVGMRPQLALAIDELIAAGHLTSDIADAYDMMMRLKMLVCILAPDFAVPDEETRQLIATRLGYYNWNKLMQALMYYRQVVMVQWQNIFDPAFF